MKLFGGPASFYYNDKQYDFGSMTFCEYNSDELEALKSLINSASSPKNIFTSFTDFSTTDLYESIFGGDFQLGLSAGVSYNQSSVYGFGEGVLSAFPGFTDITEFFNDNQPTGNEIQRFNGTLTIGEYSFPAQITKYNGSPGGTSYGYFINCGGGNYAYGVSRGIYISVPTNGYSRSQLRYEINIPFRNVRSDGTKAISIIKFTVYQGNTQAIEMTFDTLPPEDNEYYNFMVNAEGTTIGGDPNERGGISGPGGGSGNFDSTSDPIPLPSLPTLSAVDAGFITIFNPSLTQLRSLASYLWSDLFSVETFKKLFADPMELILGLNIVPVAVPEGSTVSVKFGGVDTGVSMTKAATQFVQFNCGTVTLNEYWGSALDYSPNTKIQLFLPFIGTEELDVDDVMGNVIGVVYNIDILTGSCVAHVTVNGTVMYQFNGSCAETIPVTGSNFVEVIKAGLGAIGLVATGMSTGGIGAAGAAAGGESTALVAGAGTSLAVESEFSAGPITLEEQRSLIGGAAGGGARSAGGKSLMTKAAEATASAANLVGNVIGRKPHYQHSGTIAGSAGFLGVKTPYFIIERPRQSLAQDYIKFGGYPSNMTFVLGELSGFTSCEVVHLDNLTATLDEVAEIEALLKEGVIL